MLPPPDSCTLQVTPVDWLPVVPLTVAVNGSDPLATTEALRGMTATEMPPETPTVTVAVSVLEGSAMLAATTWKVPATAGAMYVPEASIIPPPTSCTDQ